jgi:undecaprenyl-diphosphooligosaccharide---protein glycotransferase
MNLFESKNSFWLFVVMLLACFAVSVGIRYQQLETWKLNPQAYFVGERPMMTTLDAPFWLRWAREYNEGVYLQKDNLRNYPDRTEAFRERFVPQKFRDPQANFSTSSSSSLSSSEIPEIRYRDVPLLSFLIAHLAPFFNYNYYFAGTLLIPVLASLFILPLGIYFFQIGVPVSGLLGGLIGTFAGGYYMRSSIGRIDTDMLNLFFPVLAALMILLASRTKSERSVLLYATGTGLSLFLFQWWYNKAGYTLIYFIVLVFSLFIQQIRFRTVLLSAILFVLCSYPGTFLGGTGDFQGFVKSYFTIEESRETLTDNRIASATFPNTFTTISEVDHVSMDEVFRRVISNPLFDWAGLIGFFGFAVFRWRILLPLAPMLALGLMSFQSSNRFIMYLAPFIGIGLGWLLQIGIEAIFLLITKNIDHRDVKNIGKSNKAKRESLNGKSPLWASFYSLVVGTHLESTTKYTDNKLKGREIDWFGWARQGVLYLGMVFFFWLISGQTAISFVPGPSIHPRLYATFLELKKRVPENSTLLTWWDYGYAITDVTGLATFHDGGGQQSPKTYFIARGLISHDQEEMYDITQFLATEGNKGIAENNTSPEALLEAVRNPKLKPGDPIYLFFTADMTGKYGAISKLGSWDLVNGGSKPRGYQNLACNKITHEEMNCRGAKIDLKAGKINNQVPLKRMVFIRDGKVMREQDFGHAQGYTLQLLVNGQQIVEVQLIDEVVFRSNYNQMFLLGRYRDDLYEETYNAFPFSRLYRVKF